MGKWLTIEEKLNADKELEENRIIMRWLKEQHKIFKKRNDRLENFIQSRKRSEHDGLFGIDGTCYKMFGKKFNELTVEQRRKYHSYRKQQRKQQAKEMMKDAQD